MTDEINSILPSIKVHQFPEIRNFNRDMVKILSNYSINFINKRKALLECPTCLGIDDFYNTEKTLHYDVFYCQGNQPLQIECQNIMGGTHTHTVACAGIIEPHFHVKCRCCDNTFLLSIPERK